MPLITEVFGNCCRVRRSLQTHERRIIGGGCHDDGAFQPIVTQDLFDEFLDLAATFANQSDHDHVRAGIACHHSEQHTFTHAGTGKQAHALPTPNGQQRIDSPNACIEYFGDRGAAEWIGRSHV